VVNVSRSRKRLIGLNQSVFGVAAHASRIVKLTVPTRLRRLLTRYHSVQLQLTAKITDPASHTRAVDKGVTVLVGESRWR
jgi:hypothetical protein